MTTLDRQIDIDYLESFENQLLERLLKEVSDQGLLNGELLASEDLDEKWKSSAPEYMAAAVPQINEFPLAAIAWAGYFGIGAAILWDTDWESYCDVDDLFSLIAKPRGFDCMDEYVTEGLMGYPLDGEQAKLLESIMLNCATIAESAIRKEQIEAQSIMAFQIFARTTKVMYRIGVAISLAILGYKYTKCSLPTT
ncbi:MAG: hypothetical protein SNJ33_00725 [Rikenellaceae bacterium]